MIFAIIDELKRTVNEGQSTINSNLSWSSIERNVSLAFHVRLEHITGLRKGFMENGDVYVFGQELGRGGSAIGAKASPNLNITSDIINNVARTVDQSYSEGKAVVARDVILFILKVYNFLVHRKNVGRMMGRMGLSWLPIRTARRTYSVYRTKAIRDFLITLDRNER